MKLLSQAGELLDFKAREKTLTESADINDDTGKLYKPSA